jgi:hypothetical protein
MIILITYIYMGNYVTLTYLCTKDNILQVLSCRYMSAVGTELYHILQDFDDSYTWCRGLLSIATERPHQRTAFRGSI